MEEKKLILTNVEHAWYKAGEAVGAFVAMEKLASELRAAASHYRAHVENPESQGQQVTMEQAMVQLAEVLEGQAVQVETESANRRKTHVQLVDAALSLREKNNSVRERISRAVDGAVKGWKGRKC